MLLEGAGFRPSGEHYGRTPTDLLAQAQCSGKVPTVAGLLGPSAGHGALVAPVCDFTIMSRQGAIFTAGPPVVKESTGEDISKEDLGGPRVALASGVIHNLADDDEGVLDDIRRYLSYFPSSAWSYPPPSPDDEACEPRPAPELLDIVPRGNRGCTTCARYSTSCSTGRTGSRCSRSSGPRSSARSLISAAIRSRWSRTSRTCSRAPSMPTPPTRQRTSSWWPTRSTCRSCSSRTTRACCRAAGRRRAGCCAAVRACSPRRRPPRHSKLHVTLRKAYGFGSMVMSLLGFDDQGATFAFPGATMGAMSAAALSRASHAAEDVESKLREDGGGGVVPVGEPSRLRRPHPSRGNPRRAACRRCSAASTAGRRPRSRCPAQSSRPSFERFGALTYAQRALARRNHSCLRPRNTLLNGNSVARPVFHRRVGRSQQTCRRGVLRIP